jgi:hypothetical protein
MVGSSDMSMSVGSPSPHHGHHPAFGPLGLNLRGSPPIAHSGLHNNNNNSPHSHPLLPLPLSLHNNNNNNNNVSDPPPDVLLALLSRNRGLEGKTKLKSWLHIYAVL